MVKLKPLVDASPSFQTGQIGQTVQATKSGHASLTEVGTRGRLLDAAMACFLEIGFTATSMEVVRQRAAVSNGSLYHHFATKQILADALYGQVLREFHAALRIPLDASPPTTRPRAQAAVRALVRRYLDWVINSPDRARLLAECKRDERLAGSPPEWQQANREGFGALAAFITQGVEAGHLQDLPADVWTALVLGPAIQLTPGWLARAAKADVVQIPVALRKTLQEAAWNAVAEVSNAPADTAALNRPHANSLAEETATSAQLALFEPPSLDRVKTIKTRLLRKTP